MMNEKEETEDAEPVSRSSTVRKRRRLRRGAAGQEEEEEEEPPAVTWRCGVCGLEGRSATRTCLLCGSEAAAASASPPQSPSLSPPASASPCSPAAPRAAPGVWTATLEAWSGAASLSPEPARPRPPSPAGLLPSSSSAQSWLTRYRPQSLSELCVHPRKVQDVSRWLQQASGAQSGQSLLVLSGPAGSGKCFGCGTRLRLYGGGLVNAEDVRGGELLMGDDSQPRLVLPGSVCRGRAPLFRLVPACPAQPAFTVSSEHVLVLAVTAPPWKRRQRSSGCWTVSWFERQKGVRGVRRRLQRCDSEQEADCRLASLLQRWSPLLWEVSMRRFLAASRLLRSSCQLLQSGAVSFPSPQLPALRCHLLSALGPGSASDVQLEWCAWRLGLWSVREGRGRPVASCACLSSRLLAAEHLFLAEAAAALPDRLLESYGLLRCPPRLPAAWLCDSLQVRRMLLAGMIDGAGCSYDCGCDCDCRQGEEGSETGVSVRVSCLAMAAGCRALAASLGLRCSAVSSRRCGLRLFLLGPQVAELARLCCCASVRREAACVPACESASALLPCGSFSVVLLPAGEYFGFSVAGSNRRFLLHDFTVTHNVSRQPQRASAPPPAAP